MPRDAPRRFATNTSDTAQANAPRSDLHHQTIATPSVAAAAPSAITPSIVLARGSPPRGRAPRADRRAAGCAMPRSPFAANQSPSRAAAARPRSATSATAPNRRRIGLRRREHEQQAEHAEDRESEHDAVGVHAADHPEQLVDRGPPGRAAEAAASACGAPASTEAQVEQQHVAEEPDRLSSPRDANIGVRNRRRARSPRSPARLVPPRQRAAGRRHHDHEHEDRADRRIGRRAVPAAQKAAYRINSPPPASALAVPAYERRRLHSAPPIAATPASTPITTQPGRDQAVLDRVAEEEQAGRPARLPSTATTADAEPLLPVHLRGTTAAAALAEKADGRNGGNAASRRRPP